MPAIILVVVCGSVAAQLGVNPPAVERDGGRRLVPVLVTQSQWTDSVSKSLPCYRSDMEGDRKEPLTLQWSAHIDQIRSQLRSRGWVEGTDLSVRSLLSFALPNVAAIRLPVLPKLNNGAPSSLVFIRPGNTRDERDVLRFWSSGYAIEDGSGASPAPILVGSLVHERLYRPSWPINILRADKKGGPTLDAHDEWVAGGAVVVLAKLDCHGVPVMLLASREE
jgi:hypothetical protein